MSDTIKTAGRNNAEASLNRMLDMSIFMVAWGNYLKLLEGEEGEQLRQNEDVDKHWESSNALMVRAQRSLASAIESVFDPLLDEVPGFTVLRPSWKFAIRPTKGLEQARLQAEFLLEAFNRLQSKQTFLRETFSVGRQPMIARQLARAAREDDPRAAISQLAALPSLSSIKLYRSWVKAAAKIIGAAPSPTASLVAEVEEAQDMGNQIRELKARAAGSEEGSEKEADLRESEVELHAQVDALAEESEHPEVVRGAAVQAIATPTEHATAMGRRLGHTMDQERAMMVRDRSIIAAGAGSGKTRVLASKVAWHIEEGTPARSILATSFTGKASAELVRRVRKYGGVIPKDAADGFGTTHWVAGAVLNNYGKGFKRASGYIGKKETWKQVTLVRLAIEQVKMQGSGKPAPAAKGFWELPDKAEREQQELAREQQEANNEFAWAVGVAGQYFNWIQKQKDNGAGWARARRWDDVPDIIRFLRGLRDRQAYPADLSPREKAYANKIFAKAKHFKEPLTYRVAATEPPISVPGVKLANDDADVSDLTEEMAKDEKKRSTKLEQYNFFGRPANEWFNLGIDLVRESQDAKGNTVKKDIPLGEFKQYISIVKGKGLTPSQAWAGTAALGLENRDDGSKVADLVLDAEDPQAAVYAAYEWLKGSRGEPEFQNLGDLDDLLIDCVQGLVRSPKMRQAVQSRFKVLLIDEAQDLNRVQHNMFGLMAGYLDPETLEPNADKSMTADTYTLIGDGKQAIYAFRGADPSEFIRKSDLTPGGDDFTTSILKLNFRSGEKIVKAANQLIAHNTRQGQQIPMVCDANTKVKGQGEMVVRPADDIAAAAVMVSEEVLSRMDEGLVPSFDPSEGSGGYATFGIALRSNAEAYAYGVEMLKRGIPFKSNARFFNDKNSKALIGWLTLAEGGSTEKMNKALLDALSVPVTKMSPATVGTRLQDMAHGVLWADWLQSPRNQLQLYGQKMQPRVQLFAANVKAAQGFTGSSMQVLGQILELKGLDGASFKEALIDSVREDADVMAELEAESDGPVPNEAIVERAMAPIGPLLSLLETKDELGAAMEFVRTLQDVNKKIASKDTEEEIDRNAVTIGTMHSWKGLECSTMYVPMVGGRFPRTGKEGETAEGPDLWNARRLAYVAITRAEDRCVVIDIPNPKFGFSSQFLSEMCVPTEEGEEPSMPTRMASYTRRARLEDDEQDAEEELLYSLASDEPEVDEPEVDLEAAYFAEED